MFRIFFIFFMAVTSCSTPVINLSSYTDELERQKFDAEQHLSIFHRKCEGTKIYTDILYTYTDLCTQQHYFINQIINNLRYNSNNTSLKESQTKLNQTYAMYIHKIEAATESCLSTFPQDPASPDFSFEVGLDLISLYKELSGDNLKKELIKELKELKMKSSSKLLN